MVVGMRHTSRLTRIVTGTSIPTHFASGWSVPTTRRKMSVRAESRMERAISLGVFCRLAPSMSAIMRSMKP